MSGSDAPALDRSNAGGTGRDEVRGMFNRIAGRYDVANRAMSMGIDVLWRRRAIARLLHDLPGDPTLLDLGAGTLDGAIEIVRQRGGARVIGADFARGMLEVGRGKLDDATRAAVLPAAADGRDLPFREGGFDGAFTAFCVRNIPGLARAARELRRVIRPGGRLVVLEFFRPTHRRPFMDGVWNARVLPLVGWAITGDRDAYRYLPESIARFATRAEFEDILRDAGFADVEGRDFFPSGVASLVEAS